MTTPHVERPETPKVADERATLEAFLDLHRATLLMKCEGLSDEQLKLRSVEPSRLSLLGLLRHLTDVERGWFRRGVGQQRGPEVAPVYSTEGNEEGSFEDLDDPDVATVLAAYRDEMERCRAATAGIPLDTVLTSARGVQHSVRWIYLHMLEEYARHNGHADLLRERIDGATGE